MGTDKSCGPPSFSEPFEAPLARGPLAEPWLGGPLAGVIGQGAKFGGPPLGWPLASGVSSVEMYEIQPESPCPGKPRKAKKLVRALGGPLAEKNFVGTEGPLARGALGPGRPWPGGPLAGGPLGRGFWPERGGGRLSNQPAWTPSPASWSSHQGPGGPGAGGAGKP